MATKLPSIIITPIITPCIMALKPRNPRAWYVYALTMCIDAAANPSVAMNATGDKLSVRNTELLNGP